MSKSGDHPQPTDEITDCTYQAYCQHLTFLDKCLSEKPFQTGI